MQSLTQVTRTEQAREKVVKNTEQLFQRVTDLIPNATKV